MSTASHKTSPVSPQGPPDLNGDFTLRIQKSLKWWIALSFVFLSIQAAWLLSEREPNNKELTFAYRVHVIDALRDNNQVKPADLYRQLNDMNLVKRDCEKLADEKYRCRTSPTRQNHPLVGSDEANEAIYYRDQKGWRLSPAASL